jgi:general secretion pathway protein B
MSYILEALKKLEQKRKQDESAVNPLAFQAVAGRGPGKRPLWPYVLCVALLLNGAGILWWVGPWREAERGRQLPPPVNQSDPSVPASPASTENKDQALKGDAKEVLPPVTSSTPPVAAAIKEPRDPPLPAPSRVAPQGSVAKQPAQTRNGSREARARTEAKAHVNGRIARLYDLPASVAAGLPDLKMSLHYYNAEPQARFARINDKTLREGQTLIEGLKVEEIIPAGVVFTYQGHRFLIGINENQ